MAGKFVDVTLRLIDKMTSPLNSAGAKLKDSANQWTKAGKQIQSTGKSISAVGASLTKKVTVPVVALGTAAVKNFGDVDKSLKLVKSTMGDTAWATADLEGEIKNAAAKSVYSMQNAADATLNFARQGFNAKQSADMLTPALSLAAGTATDLSMVTDGLGSAVKIFTDQGMTAANASNIFAKAQAQAKTDVGELFDAVKTSSSIYKTVGWSLQDLATVTDVFGDANISGAEGANAMKTGLARLVEPAKGGATWIKRLGINVTNADGTMKSMVTVQSQLHDKFSKLTQEEQMQAASAIFGKNQMAKWLTLISAAPSTVQKYRDSLDGLSGTADKMADSLMSGVGGSIEKLKSTFDVFKYTIGSALGDSAKKVIDKVTGLMTAFNKLDPAMQKNIIKLALTAAAAGPAILIFGKMVTTAGKVASNVGKVGKAFKTFGSIAGIVTSPAGIVVAVLLAIVAAGILVWKNWDKIKAVGGKAFGYISKVMHACGGKSESLKKAIKPISTELSEIWKSIKTLWEIASPYIKKFGSEVKLVLGITLGGAIGGAIGLFKSLFNSATTVIGGILQVFNGLLQFVTGVFTGNWRKAWTGIQNIFGGAFKALVGLCKTPINAVIGIINGAIAGINKLGVKIPSWVPGIGGKSFSINIPKIPQLAKGTKNWRGGIVQVHEQGGEIIDLPRGSRVYPHDESVQMAYKAGRSGGGKSVVVQKFADQIVIREEADIHKFAKEFVDLLEKTSDNMGGDIDGYIPELG